MKLVFKNFVLKSEYEMSKKTANLTGEQFSQFMKKHNYSDNRMAFTMPCGYVSSLCEIIEEFEGHQEDGATLDLTYDTVKHLPLFLGQQYFAYVASGSFTSQKALEILRKTLAAYLMLLCMNEHGCVPEIQRYINLETLLNKMSENQTDAYSWMGFTISVGAKEKYDLLMETEQAANVTAKGVLRIRVAHICEIYKRMCGVDLKDKGLENFEGCI